MNATGLEEEAFDAYRLAVEADWDSHGESFGAHVRVPYLRVAEEYPDSRYARMALMRAAEISQFLGQQWPSREDLVHALDEYQRVIDKYPGTREAKKASELRSFIPEYLEKLDAAVGEHPEGN